MELGVRKSGRTVKTIKRLVKLINLGGTTEVYPFRPNQDEMDFLILNDQLSTLVWT